MWSWIKRSRDWAMHELWPTHRISPQPQALQHSYEKAGLTIHDQPIPWNAEAVVVEAVLRLPAAAPRRKSDFQLCLGRREIVSPEAFRQEDGASRLSFRLPAPAQSTSAELVYQNQAVGQLTLPVLSREEFIARLQLQMPTFFGRFGEQSVACQTFVATQCRGLLASAVVSSPTSLVPLLDMGLQIEFRGQRGGAVHRTAAKLCSSQLAGRQALITIVPRRFPRRIGAWTATWMLGDRPLATQLLRAISQRTFRRSLGVCDTRFVVQRDKDRFALTRHIPCLDGVVRVGPCFLISSREPGMAGLCRLQVRTQADGADQSALLVEQEVLISDGPTMFAPGTVDTAGLKELSGFELRCRGGVIGVLSTCAAPAADFNSEGAFKFPSEFNWSYAADEELNDRLSRLLDGRGNIA